MRYFIGLGSNIAPRLHVPLMLRALLQLAPTLHVSRVVETAPVGVDGPPFLNVAVCFLSNLAPHDLKTSFNATETRLGRDRTALSSKLTSRTADLDLLFWLDDDVSVVPAHLLPHEPYMRPMLLELLCYVGVATTAEIPLLPPGLALELDGIAFGAAPLTITLTDGHLVVFSAV